MLKAFIISFDNLLEVAEAIKKWRHTYLMLFSWLVIKVQLNFSWCRLCLFSKEIRSCGPLRIVLLVYRHLLLQHLLNAIIDEVCTFNILIGRGLQLGGFFVWKCVVPIKMQCPEASCMCQRLVNYKQKQSFFILILMWTIQVWHKLPHS